MQQQVNLRQWVTGFFTSDWQPVETIIAGRIARNLTNSYAVNTISRGKKISWQIDNIEAKIILVVKITNSSTETIDLCLQVYPDDDNNNLPTDLSVQILDKTGKIYLFATTKDNDNWIQLEFTCHPEENFQIEFNLAGIIVTENSSL